VALAAVATILLASTWLSTHAPSAAAGGPPHCNAFKGKSLLRSRTLRVIARTRGERREYAFICVPPRGRVRLAGWAFDETVSANYSVKVLSSAGTWAAIEFVSQVDFHGGEEVDKMCNARNGRCYPFFHAFTYGGQEFQEAAVAQPALEAVAVNRFGQMLLAETLGGTTYVRGVRSNGSTSTLDSATEASIPPSSLKLVGHEASWTHDGTVRRATI
jgi:hypothetical protein